MAASSSSAFYQTPAVRVRLSCVIGVFALISIGMLGRSTYLQIIGDPKLEHLAKRQFESKILMKPRRGLIVDRTSEPLAINLETSSLAGSPAKILKSPSTLHLLSRALNVKPVDLKKRLSPKKAFTWFERHLTDERIEKFRKAGIIFGTGDMPEGLWIVKEMKRVYPHGDLAHSLLGTVNVDAEGLEGVELWKNTILRGKSAQVSAIKDALGRPALMNTTNNASITTRDGETVELSIDASLQYAAEESLTNAVMKTHAQSGMVIAMDSNTGEILALAQATSGGHIKGPKKVMALTDGYEPGSTLKPLILAQAIQRGVVKAGDSLFGHYGKLKIQGRTISEAEAHEKFGYISLKKMVEVSSNVVAAELALKVGPERLVASFQDLELGKRTGTTFPGEINGWVPTNPKMLKPLTIATLGFGQSLLVTPMQMVRGYAALANGGFLVEPTLMKRKEGEVAPRREILKGPAVKEVTDALLLVTEGEKGTGHLARVEGYRIAGKTGTAQTVDPVTKRYSGSRYIASFIGFPVGVRTPITVLALLDSPKGIYYAGSTAAPLFSEVMKHVVNRFSIPATEKVAVPLVDAPKEKPRLDTDGETIQVAQSSAEVAQESAQSAAEVNVDHPLMPSLVGLTPQEAIVSLRPFAPQIQIKGFGLIKRQEPVRGAILAPNVRVTLYLEE
jgi:cell division protein FtsI (penicillin-binding protein 3)